MQEAVSFGPDDTELQFQVLLKELQAACERLSNQPEELQRVAPAAEDPAFAQIAEIQRREDAFFKKRAEQHLLGAFLMALFAAFEFGLVQQVSHKLQQGPNPRRLAHYKGRSPFIQCKCAMINLGFEEDWFESGPWRVVDFIRVVRNAFVHDNGLVADAQKARGDRRLVGAVDALNGVSFSQIFINDDLQELTLEREFLFSTVDSGLSACLVQVSEKLECL